MITFGEPFIHRWLKPKKKKKNKYISSRKKKQQKPYATMKNKDGIVQKKVMLLCIAWM